MQQTTVAKLKPTIWILAGLMILSLVIVLSVPSAIASDDALSDRLELEEALEEEREEEIADEIEDELDLEEDIEDELQDDLEDELEERIEAMVEDGTITEEMEDALEDRLEEMIESGQLVGDGIEAQLESLIEEQLNSLPGRYEDLFDDQSQLADIEQALMDFEVFAMEDEFIALMDEANLEAAKQQGAKIISVEAMDELGQLLVTFAEEPPEQDVQANHIYTLDAQNNSQTQQSPNGKPQGISLAQASLLITTQPSALQNLRIGMMDSAIYNQHLCFKNTTILQQSFTPKAAQPDYQHGTAMASAINQCGGLGGIQLFNAEVFARTPKGLIIASAADLIKGLNWLLKQNVQAINLSLSGPPNQVLARVLSSVIERGVLVMASVGNEGAAAFPRYPAAQPGVIAITAVDQSLNVYPKAVRGNHIDFSVPGVAILLAEPNGQYINKSGTSVANAIATPLILQSLQNGKTLQDLKAHAKDLGDQGKDTTFGYGLLQINF